MLGKYPGFDKTRRGGKVLKGLQDYYEGNDPITATTPANDVMVICDAQRIFSCLRNLDTPKPPDSSRNMAKKPSFYSETAKMRFKAAKSTRIA